MITLEALREFGADTERGLSMCMGNEALYLRLVGTGRQNRALRTLKRHWRQKISMLLLTRRMP